MASNHEKSIPVNAPLTPAVELAYPLQEEHGLPMVGRHVASLMPEEGGAMVYEYAETANGVGGYVQRTTVQPRIDVSSQILGSSGSSGVYTELELKPHTCEGVLEQIRLELTGSWTGASGGTDDAASLPTDLWIDRIEIRGGASGEILQTMRGDWQFIERRFRETTEEMFIKAPDLGLKQVFNEQCATITVAGSTDTSGNDPSRTIYQIELLTMLTDSSVFAPDLNLDSFPMTIRVYFRPRTMSYSAHTTAAYFTVSSHRFWIQQFIHNSDDAAAARNLAANAITAYKTVQRTEFSRGYSSALTTSQEYQERLVNLRGLSQGLLWYSKASSEALTTSLDTVLSEGNVGSFSDFASCRLLDGQSAPIVESETADVNKNWTQAAHLLHPCYSVAAVPNDIILFPFCKDFGAALHGVHSGARQLGGDEQFCVTTAGTTPAVATTWHILSYDCASLICHPGEPPMLAVARHGA